MDNQPWGLYFIVSVSFLIAAFFVFIGFSAKTLGLGDYVSLFVTCVAAELLWWAVCAFLVGLR